MIPKSTIYEWANLDARTRSIPARNEDGNFRPSNGMRKMFNHSDYASIPEINSIAVRKNAEHTDLLNQMLNQKTVYDKSKLSGEYLEEKENELIRDSAELDLIQEDINQERQRLIDRGHNPPEEIKPKESKKTDSVPKKKINFDWKVLKKWGVVFITIVVLELFFGLALWDSLRDQKSIVQVALRIAASGILVITLHMAEHRYKNTKRRIYAAYIIYGIVTLVALLIGSLVLGYFFPEHLEGSAGFDPNIFDLNTNETSIAPTPTSSLIGFFILYDFILGITAVIVFMLIGFLEIGKKKDGSDDIELQESQKKQEKTNPVFIHLLNLYQTKEVKAGNVNSLKTEVEKLKSEPDPLSLEVLEVLQNLKKRVEILEEEISDQQNLLEQRYRELEERLNQYEIDFTDVSRSFASTPFTTPVWPNRSDIVQYYKIN
jgi:hypothetical protein